MNLANTVLVTSLGMFPQASPTDIIAVHRQRKMEPRTYPTPKVRHRGVGITRRRASKRK